MPTQLPDDVRMAPVQGKKIDAIRLLRDQTSLGLAEAKEAVESGVVPDGVVSKDTAQALSNEVTAALAQGRTVEAIKLLRQTKGLSLQQAKAIIDEAAARVRPAESSATPGMAPGEEPRSSRLPVAILVLLVIAVGIGWLVLSRV